MIFRLLFLVISFCVTAGTAVAAPLEILPPDFRGGVQPQIAVAPSGRVHVVFGKGDAIYYTASADGRAFSPPVKVGELRKLALKMRRGPRVAVAGQRAIVTAISHEDGMLHGWESADEGATWKEQPLVNSVPKSAREGVHAMAGDGRGLVALAWIDLRGSGGEVWSRVSQDGGRNWGDETRVYASPDGHICECCHPSLAIGPKGEIAVLWRNWLGGSRDLWLAISRDGGRTFGETRKAGVGTWKLDGCPMDGGAVAFASDGQPVAVWRREKAILAGATPDREDRLSEAGLQPVVQTSPRGVVMVWEEGGGLMLKRDQSTPVLLSSGGRAPAMAILPDGRAALVCEGVDGVILFEVIP